MAITKLSGGSGLDFSQVTPIYYENALNVTTASVWQTIYSYNGKGFLSKVILHNTGATVAYIRITIDGSVVFYGEAYGSSYPLTGLIPENELSIAYSGTSDNIYYRQPASNNFQSMNSGAAPVVNYPYTSAQVGYVPVSNSTYFKQSVLVEFMCGVTNQPGYLSIKGGKI